MPYNEPISSIINNKIGEKHQYFLFFTNNYIGFIHFLNIVRTFILFLYENTSQTQGEKYIEIPNIYNTYMYILKGRVKIQTSYLNFGFILNFKFNTSNVQFMEKIC